MYNYQWNQEEFELFGGFEVYMYMEKIDTLCFKERERYLETPKVIKSADLKKSSEGIKFLWFLTREELRLFMEERKKDLYSSSKIKEMVKKRKIQRVTLGLPKNVIFYLSETERDD
jgi:hypothetical protein